MLFPLSVHLKHSTFQSSFIFFGTHFYTILPFKFWNLSFITPAPTSMISSLTKSSASSLSHPATFCLNKDLIYWWYYYYYSQKNTLCCPQQHGQKPESKISFLLSLHCHFQINTLSVRKSPSSAINTYGMSMPPHLFLLQSLANILVISFYLVKCLMFSFYYIILSISQGDFSIFSTNVDNESNTLVLSVPWYPGFRWNFISILP